MADPQLKEENNDTATRSPSGADLVLLLLLIMGGFGIWALVDRGVTYTLRSREPNEQKIMDAHNVTKQKAELTEKQNEIAEVDKYRNAALLEHMRHTATVESFVAFYPELRNPSPSNAPPPEAVKGYLEANRQALAASTLVAELERRRDDLKQQAITLNTSLESNKQAADSQFRSATSWYLIIKRTATFVITLVIVGFLLRLVWWILRRFAGNRRLSTPQGFRPLVLGLGALVVLFAYDQFGYAGAALIGILILLVVLRRIKWPRKANVMAK
ncbi:MAG TPA: hypothetical protein VGW58_05875 [Pyrinomonadaceae bacterium]|nr:hypothetical protein [Pyrinomonadaceae bacterium]